MSLFLSSLLPHPSMSLSLSTYIYVNIYKYICLYVHIYICLFTRGLGPRASPPPALHARPFVGVFQKSILTGLSCFGDCSPQNGSKTVTKFQNRPLEYPHEGPSVDRANLQQRESSSWTTYWSESASSSRLLQQTGLAPREFRIPIPIQPHIYLPRTCNTKASQATRGWKNAYCETRLFTESHSPFQADICVTADIRRHPPVNGTNLTI